MDFSLMVMEFSGHILFVSFTCSMVLNTPFKHISHTSVYTYSILYQFKL